MTRESLLVNCGCLVVKTHCLAVTRFYIVFRCHLLRFACFACIALICYIVLRSILLRFCYSCRVVLFRCVMFALLFFFCSLIRFAFLFLLRCLVLLGFVFLLCLLLFRVLASAPMIVWHARWAQAQSWTRPRAGPPCFNHNSCGR